MSIIIAIMCITICHTLPPKQLKQYVHRFWEVSTKANSTLRVLPDGAWDIVCNVEHGKCTLKLVGPMTKAACIPLRPTSQYYGVRLMPGTYFTPLKRDLSNFAGKVVPLDQFIPGVAVANSGPIIPQLIAMVGRVTEAEQLQRDPVVDEALREIRQHFTGSDFCVSQLTNRASMRTLERKFQRYVGVNPIRFLRIHRQLAVAEMLLRDKQRLLSEIASEFSYVDQSHMTNDVRLLAGTTPQALSKEFDEYLQYDWPYNEYNSEV